VPASNDPQVWIDYDVSGYIYDIGAVQRSPDLSLGDEQNGKL
jgi:hypothetical protein